MQRSVMNWDEVQRALMPSPSPTLSTTGSATATPTGGSIPGHPPSDGSVVIHCKPSATNFLTNLEWSQRNS